MLRSKKCAIIGAAIISTELHRSSIRLVQAFYQKGQYQFQHYTICKPEDISLLPLPFKTKNVVLSIPNDQVFTKKFYLGATLSMREKREYIALKLGQEFYFDFKVITKLENNQEEILCVAVRQELMSQYLAYFKNTSFVIKKIILDSELEKIEANNIPEDYQKVCAIAVAGLKNNGFDFSRLNKKKKIDSKKNILISVLSLLLLIIAWKNFMIHEPLKINHPIQKLLKKKSEKPCGYSLKMVGKISNKKITWGLIQEKNGKIFQIKIGDKLGCEQGKVVGIYSKKIIILDQKTQRRYEIE